MARLDQIWNIIRRLAHRAPSDQARLISRPTPSNLPPIPTRIDLSPPQPLLPPQLPRSDLRPRIQQVICCANAQAPARIHLSLLINDDGNRPLPANLGEPFLGRFLRAVRDGDEVQAREFVCQAAELEERFLCD
jgi:hypothetical protein